MRIPDASVDHTSGTRQLLANPPMADLKLSPLKPNRGMVATMGSSNMVVDEDHSWDRVASSVAGKRAG